MILAKDTNLHWRQIEMAQLFLSLMLRKDIPFPDEAVLLYFKLLVSNTIKIRNIAINFVGSWMKINKIKSVKNILQIKNMVNFF